MSALVDMNGTPDISRTDSGAANSGVWTLVGASSHSQTTETPEERGHRLQSRRKKLGLSRAAVSGRVGVRRNTISLWENGHAFPTGENLVLYAQVLNTTPEWVATGIGELSTPDFRHAPPSVYGPMGYLRSRLDRGEPAREAWAAADLFCLEQAVIDAAGLEWWMIYRQGVIDTGVYEPTADVEQALREALDDREGTSERTT